MEQNKQKLMERGEHINEVGEKATQLEDQSNEVSCLFSTKYLF
jgi:hypothetical protein